jgi:Right handed beta helix region
VTQTASATVTGSIFHTNLGDGITIYDSPAPLVWNNLVYGNGSTGILVTSMTSGSPNAQILNNTVYANAARGLVVGPGGDTPPSAGAMVLRNIFAANTTAGINVNETSLPGYVGDYNLTADAYGPFTPVGFHDVVGDPGLLDPAGPDGILGGSGAADDAFYLRQIASGQGQQSPAVDAGGMSAAAAGVAQLTTRRDGVVDRGQADLGFHYLPIDTVDCDGDGRMSVAELVRAINVALQTLPMSQCAGLDVDMNGSLSINELLLGVGRLLTSGS